MLAAGLGPILFLVVVNVLLLIGGQFMEPSGLLIIVAPLVFPIAIELGIDPIHLGIIMVVNMEIGMITPPVGLNLFVTAGVASMSVMNVVARRPPLGRHHVRVPDPGDLRAVDFDLDPDRPDGAGNHHPVMSDPGRVQGLSRSGFRRIARIETRISRAWHRPSRAGWGAESG